MEISKFKLNPNNPRIIKDDKFKKLVKSLKDFPEMMEKRPIVCVTDTDGLLYPIGGNMRLKAIKELKLKTIPDYWIMLADEWSEEQRKEFIIKDNIGFGEWDWEILNNEWDPDQLEEWGLEIEKIETVGEIKEIEIKPYTKVHVLLSFEPEIFQEIENYLQIIKNIEGIEYEQSAN